MKWIIVTVVLLSGCINNTKVPSDIIQRPKMEKIMWEMLQADRFATSFIQSRKDTLGRNRKETVDLYDKVFSYNGITRGEFIDSYKFYLSRPDILKIMFDSISIQSERKRLEIYNHPKPKVRSKTDSLKIRNDSLKNHNYSIKNRTDSLRKKIFPKSPHMP